MTKEGSKKSQRVYSKGVEAAGAKRKDGKGKNKETESRKKWKRNEEEDKDKEEDAENRELETESDWWSFVTAQMAMMDMALDKL